MGSGSVIGPSTPYIIGGDPSQVEHVQNFATGLMRSLAEKNGYNVAAAVDMAANKSAYNSDEAASVGVITGKGETLNAFLADGGLSGGPVTALRWAPYSRFLGFLAQPDVHRRL